MGSVSLFASQELEGTVRTAWAETQHGHSSNRTWRERDHIQSLQNAYVVQLGPRPKISDF